MKKLLLFLLIVLPLAMMAQEVKTADADATKMSGDPEAMYDKMSQLEQEPQYPGGVEALYADVTKYLKYPKKAKRLLVEGRVVVQFVVEKDGSISHIKVIEDSVGYGASENAVMAVKKLKKWTPGMIDGKPVRCQFALPLNYTLQ